MKNLIIIPTYNEAGNIEPLLTQIFEKVPSVNVLFVDDNSQDGTVPQIQAQMTKFPNLIHLIQRPGKLGLGTAYVTGFKWGLERDYDNLIEMDADLSHQPKYLPVMIDLLGTHDVAIGSRYIRGGGTFNWSPLRKLISKAGSYYGRAILGVNVADLTGGFNGWRRQVLEAIDIETLVGGGYVFQVELKYRAILSSFSFAEFPIMFVERVVGSSKMSLGIVIEAAIKVLFLRSRRKSLAVYQKNT